MSPSLAFLPSSLIDSLSFWEYVEYAAETIVVVGALGEFVAEFGYFPRGARNQERRQGLGKLAALFLIVGLAIELVALVRTNQLSSTAIAALNKAASDSNQKAEQAILKGESATATAKGFESQIAAANARAAEAEAQVAVANSESREAVAKVREAQAHIAQAQRAAADARQEAARLNKIAEDERLARVKIEERIAGWRLDSEGQKRLSKKLSAFPATPFDLFVNPSEASFMETLDGLMVSSGWKRRLPIQAKDGQPFAILVDDKAAILLVEGITVEVAQNRWDAFRAPVTALVEGLIAEGIPVKAHLISQGSDPNAIHLIVGRRQ